MYRLFTHHRTPPYFNMAFDEWMLNAVAGTPGELIARLYTWQVGTITFGCNQRCQTALDHSAVGDTPVIRRITGGRAVFHDLSELTYAIAFNTATPLCPALAGPNGKTSEMIALILSQFLARLGVAVDWVKASAAENSRPDYFHKAACFASHAKYELASGRSKVVASARRDWGGAALQHGSIKFWGVAPHAALNMDGIGRLVPSESVEIAELKRMATVFGATLGDHVGVEPDEPRLSPKELQLIDARTKLVEQMPLDKRDLIAHT
jgi:lipoate-protein ligase A